MGTATLIGVFATGLWNDLGMPPNVSALTISGYVVQPSTLGTINNLIGTTFSGSGYNGPGTVNYDVSPFMDICVMSIAGEMYKSSYYNGLVQATMGYGGDSIPWVTARDGDSSVSRTNGASIGAVYAKLASDARLRMNYLVTSYITSRGDYSPSQVLLPGIVYPVYSVGYVGP